MEFEEKIKIFYLNFSTQIDEFYLRLFEKMNSLGIQLIPIHPDEINYLDKNQIANVWIIIRSLKDYQLAKKYFDQLKINLAKYQNLKLIEFSSFSQLYNFSEHLKRPQTYFFSLPLEFDDIKRVFDKIRSDQQKTREKRTLGGKVALPTLVIAKS